MNLLARLLHVLLCLALAVGAPGMGGMARAEGLSTPEAGATGCHEGADPAAMRGDAAGDADPHAPQASDDCCEAGACPCPGMATAVLAVPALAAQPQRPVAPPVSGPPPSCGPPRLASPIRPPIG